MTGQAFRSHLKRKTHSQKVALVQCFFKSRKVEENIAGNKNGETETDPTPSNYQMVFQNQDNKLS